MAKTDVQHLIRKAPGVLVNQDMGALRSYVAKHSTESQRNTEIDQMKSQINTLSNELGDIKLMLKTLIERT